MSRSRRHPVGQEAQLSVVLAILAGEASMAEAARRHGVAQATVVFTGPDPLLRHVRTRVRSPQTNGVVERFFGTLKYEHLCRAIIDDGDALAVEVNLFRQTYNTRRPHQALGHRTPHDAYRSMLIC